MRTYTTFLDGEKACSVPKAMGVEVSFDALANLPSASKVENQPPPFCNRWVRRSSLPTRRSGRVASRGGWWCAGGRDMHGDNGPASPALGSACRQHGHPTSSNRLAPCCARCV